MKLDNAKRRGACYHFESWSGSNPNYSNIGFAVHGCFSWFFVFAGYRRTLGRAGGTARPVGGRRPLGPRARHTLSKRCRIGTGSLRSPLSEQHMKRPWPALGPGSTRCPGQHPLSPNGFPATQTTIVMVRSRKVFSGSLKYLKADLSLVPTLSWLAGGLSNASS